MYIKDLLATKFTALVLHMLAVCISMYARDTNIFAGLALGADTSTSDVEANRRR